MLVVMGREGDLAAARTILETVAPVMPPRFYANLVSGSADVLVSSFNIEFHGTHDRMVLVDREHINAVDTSDATQLGPGDKTELAEFYAHAYPSNWFDARMVATNAYFGVRRAGKLLSAAGVHVLSRRYQVGVLGNIATDPKFRGQGLARLVTAAVCKSLADVALIGLNVATRNHAAVAVYRALGFERVISYEEHLATTRTV